MVGRAQRTGVAVLVAAGIAAAFIAGCAQKDVNREVVATVNGEEITVRDLREYFGVPGGMFAVPGISVERKKSAVDQMIAGRLLVQEGRSLGLDNTDEYRETVKRNEVGVRINALFRVVASGKLKYDADAIKAEAGKLKKEKAGISDADALEVATRRSIERQVRAIQKELVDTAQKETGAAIDNAVVSRIGKGQNLQDNAVLASAGDEKIRYGDVKRIIQQMPQLPIRAGQLNLEESAVLIGNVLHQELVLRSLIAYSRKLGVDGSDSFRVANENMVRAVIANMTFDNVTAKDYTVTDAEVAANYAERAKKVAESGQKAPPLEAVKEQLRSVLKKEKRREAFEAHVEGLRKKAKVTVNDAVLPKV
jgi:hypothetical protein